MSAPRSHQLGRCLMIAAAALLLAACPGNSPVSRAKTDAKVTIGGATDDPTPTYTDGGATPAVDSGSPVGSLDGGAVTGTLTCQQLQQCYAACSDTDDACYQACYDKGTAAAQAQDDALYECEMNAYDVTCKSKCTTENQTCWDCCDAACATQIAACK
jgi:hypothetical protein